MTTRHPGKYAHPITAMALARSMTPAEALNWLQDRGHVSDLCVTVEEVAPCDVERVRALFLARWGR